MKKLMLIAAAVTSISNLVHANDSSTALMNSSQTLGQGSVRVLQTSLNTTATSILGTVKNGINLTEDILAGQKVKEVRRNGLLPLSQTVVSKTADTVTIVLTTPFQVVSAQNTKQAANNIGNSIISISNNSSVTSQASERAIVNVVTLSGVSISAEAHTIEASVTGLIATVKQGAVSIGTASNQLYVGMVKPSLAVSSEVLTSSKNTAVYVLDQTGNLFMRMADGSIFFLGQVVNATGKSVSYVYNQSVAPSVNISLQVSTEVSKVIAAAPYLAVVSLANGMVALVTDGSKAVEQLATGRLENSLVISILSVPNSFKVGVDAAEVKGKQFFKNAEKYKAPQLPVQKN